MKIKDLLELKYSGGDVGIEIEMEGDRPFPFLDNNWRLEADGSLRGYSAEYVMRKPVSINQVAGQLKNLKEELDKHKVKIKYTERAGVHVHVNVQKLNLDQLLCMATTYYCLEEILTNFCGPDRVGNHFCLRLQDAEAPLFALENMAKEKHLFNLDGDWRYASMNFLSLFKYGSLEFRAMATNEDLSRIKEWCDILVAIREYAKVTPIMNIPDNISGYGPKAWAEMVLGKDLFKLVETKNAEASIMDGLRRVQSVIYEVY